MVGGIANQYGPDGRWLFALGSFIAAATCFRCWVTAPAR